VAGYRWLDISLRNEVDNDSRWTNRLHVPDIRWTQDEQGDGQRRGSWSSKLGIQMKDKCLVAASLSLFLRAMCGQCVSLINAHSTVTGLRSRRSE
jgi:hypothetical protein